MSIEPKYRGHLKVIRGEGRKTGNVQDYIACLTQCMEEWSRRGPEIVTFLEEEGAMEEAGVVAVVGPALAMAAARIRLLSISRVLPA